MEVACFQKLSRIPHMDAGSTIRSSIRAKENVKGDVREFCGAQRGGMPYPTAPIGQDEMARSLCQS